MKYSIVNYISVKGNSDFRIDAEFYYPDNLNKDRLLQKFPIMYFGDKVDIQFGTTPNGANFMKKGIPFIRSQDFPNGFIDEANLVFISEKDHLKQKKSALQNKDILIAAVGATIGKIGFCLNIKEGNINQNIARLRLNYNINIFPEFLFVFMLSKFGQYQLGKLNTGNAQSYLNSQNIAALSIVELKNDFQEIIKNIVLKSNNFIEQSKSLYSQAEQLLLSELRLSDWKPKQELAFVKNFSDAQKAERFDAEYFEPKYDEIIKAVKSYSNGWDIIGNVFRQSKSIFKIADIDKTYKYVEIGSINVLSGEIIPEIIKGIELPVNAKIKLYKDDILISKVRAYRGAITFVMDNDFIGSGAFTVLKEKGAINKEVLIAYFKSKPILNLTFKYNTGTAYPTLFDSDILNMPIPIFKKEVQDAVKEKIQKSFKCRELSKQLLEIAKRGVETAIEKSEEEAEKWINYNLTELNKT